MIASITRSETQPTVAIAQCHLCGWQARGVVDNPNLYLLLGSHLGTEHSGAVADVGARARRKAGI